MSCSNCEQSRSLGFKFCPNCGGKVISEEVNTQTEVCEKLVEQNIIYEEPVKATGHNEQYKQVSHPQPGSYQQKNYQRPKEENHSNQHKQKNTNRGGTGKVVDIIPLLAFIFALCGGYFAMPGLVLAIIGLVKLKTYDPKISNLKLNKIFSIVAVIVSVVGTLWLIAWFIVYRLIIIY